MGHPKRDNFGGKMYIKNGICYAGKLEEGIKVSEVKHLRGMMGSSHSLLEKNGFLMLLLGVDGFPFKKST